MYAKKINQHKWRPANLRTSQYHNYTGCTAGLTIRKQRDGHGAVRTFILDHITSTGTIAMIGSSAKQVLVCELAQNYRYAP